MPVTNVAKASGNEYLKNFLLNLDEDDNCSVMSNENADNPLKTHRQHKVWVQKSSSIYLFVRARY